MLAVKYLVDDPNTSLIKIENIPAHILRQIAKEIEDV
jgi:hypothetical protein